MNKKRLFTVMSLLVAAVALALPSGCIRYTAPVMPPRGGLIDITKAPLMTNGKGTPCGPEVKKVSQSKSCYFHDIFFTGLDFAWNNDELIARIAREGGIKTVYYADYERLFILGLYAELTVNVYGN